MAASPATILHGLLSLRSDLPAKDGRTRGNNKKRCSHDRVRDRTAYDGHLGVPAGRALYEELPASLKDGAELRCGITGAELRTPSDEAADWLRGHMKAA